MKIFKLLANILVVIALFLAVTSCQNHKKIVYKPTPKYDTSFYCSNDNIAKEFIKTDKMIEILDNPVIHPANLYAKTLIDSAAFEVAGSSQSVEKCISTFKKGEQIFNKTLNKYRSELAKKGGSKPSKDLEIAKIQDEITYFWRDDQSARKTMIHLKTENKQGADYWGFMLSKVHTFLTDNKSITYLENLLDKYDWVDNVRFGSAVSNHAWIMIQHADLRPDLQAEVLKRMKPYFNNNKIKAANYAYLWDRVAVNTNKKQLYGTQPNWDCIDGKMELQPLEKPETVNQRRAEMGMGTVEKALEAMNLSSCGK